MSKSRSERLGGWLACLALAALGGCTDGSTCVRESDCRGNTVCRVGRCVVSEDAGAVPDAPAADSGDAPGSADAPVSSDAGAPVDAADDAAADDAAVDDAAVDGGVDAP